ncbi:unnamed protein product [Lathyrus oleraceus]
MDEHTKVSDHLSVLHGFVSELETIGVKIDDEDKSLRIIWYLSSSYEHIKPVLIYGKKTLSFEEFFSNIISEERRLKGGENTSSNSMLVASEEKNEMGVICWKYGKLGHIKYKCIDGETSEKGSESNASNVSLVVREDDLP